MTGRQLTFPKFDDKMQMDLTNCPRCHCGFYSTAPVLNICCPFCGYSFIKTDHSEKRLECRKPIQKECVLANGFGMITVSAVDISEKGLGLVINGKVPFKKSDKLIASLDIRASWCHVMWVKALNETTFKVGLKFFQASLHH